MPATYSYPGVYIEEIPSGVRTIASVSTSDTAFVDVFRKGPTDRAVRITSFTDFARVFGGLDNASEASYAIKQYYLNGGSVAWVIRVVANDAKAARIPVALGADAAAGEATFTAASKGAWGNNLQIAIQHLTTTRTDATGQVVTDLFNLAVREVEKVNGRPRIVASEVYRNLSLDPAHTRFVEDVLAQESALLRVTGAAKKGSRPADSTIGDVVAKVGDLTATFKSVATGDTAGSDGTTPASITSGLPLLRQIAPFVFNILCLPSTANLKMDTAKSVIDAAAAFCIEQRAFYIIDLPSDVTTDANATGWISGNDAPARSNYAAIYFPQVEIADPLQENRPRRVGISGTMAGVFARTDATRGIWKAPAGTDATLRGVTLTRKLTDLENGGLNPLGINVLRQFPIYGNVSWGARTREGSDAEASEWKYIPVRRTALFIEESLYQGLKWVVFEPNDERLWAQIRLNVGAFMHGLYRRGAFQGKSPRDAYLVKCDGDTTTQADINLGIVNILVGFAPLKPAEFVVLQIQQLAGQLVT